MVISQHLCVCFCHLKAVNLCRISAAAFCMTKIDNFRKENLKNENSKKEDEPKKEDESKYEDEPKETNKNVESTCLFQLAFE